MSLIAGLTGGIGSGKSVVAKLFSVMGCPVYNSDERARAMYYRDDVKKRIVEALSAEAYLNDGRLNKKFVSQQIFSNDPLRHKVNSIIHPAVKEDMMEFIKENSSAKVIIKETALLFEAGIESQVNKIILVTAPEALRIQRVQQRDGLSEAEVKARIQSQWPDELKKSKSDFVVMNDDEQALIPQALKIYEALLHV